VLTIRKTTGETNYNANEQKKKMEMHAPVSKISNKAPWESVSYSGAGEDGAGCSDMEITTAELGAPVKNKSKTPGAS
jgi:hypothetical protein